MNILDSHTLKSSAREALDSASGNPQRLVLIHTGIIVAFLLVCTVLSFILQDQISNTGGLGGIGIRSILSTANTLVQLAGNLVLPFWEIGFVYAMMKVARHQEAEASDLLQGFHRFGPVLRLSLLQTVLYLAIFFLCFQLGSIVFLMTPFSNSYLEIAQSLTDLTAVDEASTYALMESMIPMYVISGLLFAVIAVPLAYGFRMAQYLLLDDPKGRALAALAGSRQMMRGNRFSLFRLDMSFWWYYLLEVLLAGLCYGDLLLTMMGIELSVSTRTVSIVFYVLYLLGSFALACWQKTYLTVTYAGAYDTLRTAIPETPVQPQPQRQSLPWKEE